jgi:diguanylate cyclase (GGDEF)-like protein/PAS domain S-box-containing protein
MTTVRTRQRTAAWIALAFVVPLLFDLKLFLSLRESRHDALERAQETLRITVSVVGAEIDQTFGAYDRLLSGVAETISLRGGLSAQPDLTLHRLLLRRHARTPELRSLYVVRRDGDIAEISTGFPVPALNVSDRPYFRRQMANDAWDNRLFIDTAVLSKLTGQTILPISRRIEDDDGRLIGVVAAAVRPAHLESILRRHELPPGFSLRLFRDDGSALACLPHRDDCYESPAIVRPPFVATPSAHPSGDFARGTLLHGTPGPGAYFPSPLYGIVTVATADKAAVLAPWRSSLGGVVLATLAANLLFAGLVLYAFRQVSRRRDAMSALAEANQRLEERVAARTAELRRSEDRARLFMNTARDAVVVVNDERRIVEFSPAAERMFGYRRGAILGERFEKLMPPGSASARAGVTPTAHTMTHGHETVGRHRDGGTFPIDVTIGSASDGDATFHVGIIRDATERRLMEHELQRQARIDELTGLLNRRAFTAEAARLMALTRRHARPLALLVVDADRFKTINDRYGHTAGDAVLRTLAARLQDSLRENDVAGRLGGEEFAVLLPETDAAGAQHAAERLLATVRERLTTFGEHSLAITVSIGASLAEPGDADFGTLFARADKALYDAKHGGRDRVVIAQATEAQTST